MNAFETSRFRFAGYLLTLLLVIPACTSTPDQSQQNQQQQNTATQPKKVITVPSLDQDSAYAFVRQQVEFGPRIPGSSAHAACASWLEAKLKGYGLTTQVQTGVATTFDHRKYTLKNIIGAYNPDKKNRILLCAHWDTRPFADRDEGPNKNKPFDGANDGASGVGVLIEVARQLSLNKPDIGVDIIFFDLEDYGQPDDSNYPDMENSWCLGSQYWALHPHVPGYYARFGILLDMVGAKGAVFPKEGTSVHFASGVVDRVWNTAAALGYGSFFVNSVSPMNTDDHLYINRAANIPCIDILHYNVMQSDFFPHHHRVTDNMEQIDPAMLKMVGQLLLQVIYDESANAN